MTRSCIYCGTEAYSDLLEKENINVCPECEETALEMGLEDSLGGY